MHLEPLPFSKLMGIDIVSVTPDLVIGELKVREDLCTRPAVLHGGAYMAFADEVGGLTAGLNLMPGMRTTTVESKTNFFRACPPGRLTAESVPLHVGRCTIVVQTSIYTPEGKRAAIVTQTQLVMPRERTPH